MTQKVRQLKLGKFGNSDSKIHKNVNRPNSVFNLQLPRVVYCGFTLILVPGSQLILNGVGVETIPILSKSPT